MSNIQFDYSVNDVVAHKALLCADIDARGSGSYYTRAKREINAMSHFASCFLIACNFRAIAATTQLYAIDKVTALARVLNGGVFEVNNAQEETLIGTILALGAGKRTHWELQNALELFMNRNVIPSMPFVNGNNIPRKKTYTAANVQVSSALNALRALDVLRFATSADTAINAASGKSDNDNRLRYVITDTERFQRALEGTQGIRATASPSSPSVPFLALPAPSSVNVPADTAVPSIVGMAMHEYELTHAEMLMLESSDSDSDSDSDSE